MHAETSPQDRALLTVLQQAFPLTSQPYVALGERLGQTAEEIVFRVETLKRTGLIRQIGAIFSTEHLGYRSTLAALCVEPQSLVSVAEAVSRHPGVSHNYARAHAYNLWFTLALPPGRDLEEEVQGLAEQPGVRDLLVLPRERTFKIDARFRLSDDARPGTASSAPSHSADAVAQARLSAKEICGVRALQEDLPPLARPFDALASRFGLTEEELLSAARSFQQRSVMRRYGATLRHREAGYVANAMVCWEVPEERLEEAGIAAAVHHAVSHCYARAAHPPRWPYRLYTMVHARSPQELEAIIAELAAVIVPRSYAALHSVHEFKKIRLRYFCEKEGRS